MCGIAGIVGYGDPAAQPVDREELRRMRDAMAARGPDGAGEWLSSDGSVGLAHRRLAIIDLDPRAAQPMLSADGSLAVVFNGEIYNYRELKRELERAGAVFRTESDTEVLLHLYRECGERMVERLRGMFAFALWDARAQSLFLARDPFGIKPLYCADDGKTFRFASQVKALAAGGGISREPSAAGMAGFLLWGHVPEPWTWLATVKALPAGSTLTVRRGVRIPHAQRYFDLRQEIVAAQDSPPTDSDAVREALALIEDSVRHHLVADVPVGLFLSAGRDSTLLGALAARHVTEPLRTVTLGFDEYRGTGQDEAPVAEAVAKRLGSRHETRRIDRTEFEAERERILAAMDQPSIDGVNTWFVSRAAAQSGLKVALSGLGGDELFGGYPSFSQVPRLARRLRLLAWAPALGRAFRIAGAPVVARIANPKWASLFEYGSTIAGAWLLRRSLFMPWELPRVMDADLARRGLQELAPLEALRAHIAGIRNPQLAVMALEMSGYMRNQLLRDADWAGMAHSVEIRVPLVDYALFRRWIRIAAHRFPLDRQRLIEAADASIAAILAARPKSGFSVPVAEWSQARPSAPPRGRGLRPWAESVANAWKQNLARQNGRARADSRRDDAVTSAGDRPAPQPPRPYSRILLYRFGQLGDTLVALPAFRAVRTEFPDAKIVLLDALDSGQRWVTASEVLPPGLVDEVLSYPSASTRLGITRAVNLLKALRGRQFDLLVYLVPRTRSRWSVARDLVFFRLAGIRRFAAHRGIDGLPPRGQSGWLPVVEHEAEHLLNRLKHSGIGANVSVAQSLQPELSREERAAAEEFLRAQGVSGPGRRLIGFGPGSKWPSKRWPRERFLELGHKLLDAHSIMPIVFGGRDEYELGEELIRNWGCGVNAAGRLTVRVAAAVLQCCDLYVGNDTGTMHLAAAVGTPCVAIFSAQDWPGRWYPYGDHHLVLRKALPCEGCQLVMCAEHDNACLRAITVDEVLAACRRVLRESGS